MKTEYFVHEGQARDPELKFTATVTRSAAPLDDSEIDHILKLRFLGNFEKFIEQARRVLKHEEKENG